MGKTTSCFTIMLSWSSCGVGGPLEIDLVFATTGDIITVDPSIDLTKGATPYKWTVDVHRLQIPTISKATPKTLHPSSTLETSQFPRERPPVSTNRPPLRSEEHT